VEYSIRHIYLEFQMMLRRISCVAVATACSIVAVNASSGQSVFVDYAPDTESLSGSFIPPFTFVPGTLADGPFTIGGTLDATDAEAIAGVTIFGNADGVTLGSFDAERRSVFEYDLAAIRNVSAAPADVLDASFSLVFDDPLFTDDGDRDRLVNSFALEVYTDTADGVLFGLTDSTSGGVNTDFDGGAIATLAFEADAAVTAADFVDGTTNFFSGAIDGPTVSFFDDFGDADLANGFVGFDVDVTSLIAGLVDDTSVSHVGFRLLSTETANENNAFSSLDAPGFGPNLVVEVASSVPEPSSVTLLVGALALGAARRKRS